MEEYIPYSENTNIEARVQQFCNQEDIEAYYNENESDEDEYIVEKIITKKFNNRTSQYEFLVKWKDYSDKFNTWELSSNIPDNKLVEFERSLVCTGQNQTNERRPGLRERNSLKNTFRPDFISNM